MIKKFWIYIYLMLLPIIDLITSIQARVNPSGFSIGMLIKGIFLVSAVIYILFYSGSKYRKISFYYFLLVGIFILLYFITKLDLLNLNFFMNEIKYLFKIVFMPIMFCFFLNYFEEHGFNKKAFIISMVVTLLEYVLLLVFPLIFNIAFESYADGLEGYVGLFYAANEISVIMVLLLPFIYYLLNNRFKNNFIISLPILYIIAAIGTKVSLAGTIIITVSAFLFILIKFGFKFNGYIIGSFFILGFTIFVFFFANDITINNVKDLADKQDFVFIDTPTNIDEDESLDNTIVVPPETPENSGDNTTDEKPGKFPQTTPLNKTNEIIKRLMKFLLSGRDVYYLQTKNIYEATYKAYYPVVGMGFSNTERINNSNIDKLIEIDYLDLYYHTGTYGLVIVLIPYLYVAILVLKSLYKDKHSKEKVCYILYNSLVICLSLGIAAVAGHVLYSPAVSIYLVLYLMYLLYFINKFEKKEIDGNKISILSLHLGYGGVEQVIANTANMLCDNYNVEITCLYRKVDKSPFQINDKVKINYLTRITSNREEFKKALKHFNIFKVLKEGIKAIYILINKKIWLKKAIIKSDAKIIISTRDSFSKLLNKHGREESIKIHQEHTYSISDKYIHNLNKLKNIDYVMPVSNSLYEKYTNKIKTKMVYIPLALNYFPSKSEQSKLNNKNLIAIGRCEPEKGFADLLDIISKLNDKEIFLNMFGDGSQLSMLKEKAKELKIDKNVKFWGFKDQEFIRKYLQSSSLYIMTSYEESFGLVLIEAMSFGVPCVAYDSAQGAKFTINNKNGYYIKDRDEKQMVNTIKKYFKLSEKEKVKMGTEAYKTSLKHNFEDVKKDWLSFIGSIME